MPVTNEQLTYTYLSQGLNGTPYPLKADAPQTVTFHPSPLLPAMPDLNISTINKGAHIIMTWATYDDYVQYLRDTQNSEYMFFKPKTHYGNIYSLSFKGAAQGDAIRIIAKDNNGNEIRNDGVAPPYIAYQTNSTDLAPDYTQHPISLILRGDLNNAWCFFSFASEFSSQRNQDYPNTQNYFCDLSSGATSNMEMLRMMLDESMIPDEDGGAPTGDEDGGGGLFDYPYTPIGEPALPNVSICDTGMISLYTVSPSDMYQLAQKLWSQNFFDTIIKNFQSPMDNIVSLHVVPFNVYAATQSNIIIGNYDTEIPSNMLTTTYFDIDCGIIELTGAYKTFADYAPFTDLALYLPYIGIVPISPDDIMNGAINVKYHIDVFSGACVAFVMSLIRGQWTVLNQYQGNILTQFPITGADYTNVYVGAMQVANTAIQTGMQVATAPSAVNSVSAATNGITQGISQAMQARPTFQRSGNVTSAAGLMSVQTPYLIITKPNYIQAKDFRAMKGYVSNLSCTIGEESGFISATVNNEQLTGMNATQDEKNMLRQLLAEGVYI